MACFSPKLIMPAVSFIGENVTADMQERGGKIGPSAIKAAAQITAGVVQAATTGNTSGLGKALNSGAASVLSASQGNPGELGRSLPGLASGIKDLLPKDGQAGGADGDYTSNGGVGDDARKTQSTPDVQPDGADHSGSSQVMDAAAKTDGNETGSGLSSVPPAPQPTPDVSVPNTPSAPGAPGVPGAPGPAGGQGGSAHAEGGQGGQGADGGQGGQGSDGGQGGQGGTGGQGGSGGRGGNGGMGGSSGGSNPYQGVNGSPSGPTVG